MSNPPEVALKFDSKTMANAIQNMSNQFKTMTLTATPVLQAYNPRQWIDPYRGKEPLRGPCDVLIVGCNRADCEAFLSDMEDVGEFEPQNGSRRQVRMVSTVSGGAHQLRGLSVRASDVLLTPSWRVGDGWREVARELTMILAFHREGLSDCREWVF